MATQPLVLSQGDLTGNIGQCQANVSNIKVDWLHTRSIGINSCTGATVADYTYLDGIGVAGGAFSFVFGAGIAFIALIFVLGIGIAIIAKVFRL